jgi:hypothetical protein
MNTLGGDEPPGAGACDPRGVSVPGSLGGTRAAWTDASRQRRSTPRIMVTVDMIATQRSCDWLRSRIQHWPVAALPYSWKLHRSRLRFGRLSGSAAIDRSRSARSIVTTLSSLNVNV